MERTHGRALVVDHRAAQRSSICTSLSDAGYVVLAAEPDAAIGAVIAFEPDVIVARLDDTPTESIPSLRGPLEIPVIVIVGAETSSPARVAATLAGSDSLFTEPVEFDLLMARVDVLLRHRLPRRVLSVGDLIVDQRGHVVRRDGVELQLTATEFNVLLHLVTNAGQVVSKRQLLERVWRFEEFDVNIVEVHISALRRKLEAAGPRLIQTVRGFGYVLRSGPQLSVRSPGSASPRQSPPFAGRSTGDPAGGQHGGHVVEAAEHGLIATIVG